MWPKTSCICGVRRACSERGQAVFSLAQRTPADVVMDLVIPWLNVELFASRK